MINEKEDEEIKQRKYQELKIRLEELESGKKRRYTIFAGVLSSITGCLCFFFIFKVGVYEMTISDIVYSFILGGLMGIAVSLCMYIIFDLKESRIRREVLAFEAEDIQKEVQDDLFENSIKMSYKYLDQYYLQTREQAQKGFFVTVCVSIFGAILIGVGIVAMFLEKAEPSYVTCASGVIIEFIAAVFFYLYNRTVASMSKYHNKLVLSHNISIALKVADTLPTDDKIKSKNEIISELLKDINTYLIKSDLEDDKKSES